MGMCWTDYIAFDGSYFNQMVRMEKNFNLHKHFSGEILDTCNDLWIIQKWLITRTSYNEIQCFKVSNNRYICIWMDTDSIYFACKWVGCQQDSMYFVYSSVSINLRNLPHCECNRCFQWSSIVHVQVLLFIALPYLVPCMLILFSRKLKTEAI